MDVNKTPTLTYWRRRPVRAAALGLSSAAAIALAVGMAPVQATTEQQQATAAAPVQAWPGYADLIEQVMPSVVAVTAERPMPKELVAGEDFGGPDEEFDFRQFGEGDGAEMFKRFMERFFGEQMPFGDEEMPFGRRGPRDFGFQQPMAMGSGFVIDENGLVVTNNHVVAGASEVTVTLHDGTELTGEVIGRDPDTDLALVKIDAAGQDLHPVRFADSDKVRVGDPVIAIGSPFGLGGTVTAGIVSADHRVIGAGRFDDFLQIDAPINRGNSGGPTFNLNGEVVGVNTAIHSPSGGNVGIGFAIPANLALEVVQDLRDDGTVERGWLGVYIQEIDEDLARSFDLDEPKGALVSRVTPDSPAAEAGFQQGDVIVRYAGKEIETLRDLTGMVAETDPGSDVDVVVLRDGQEQTLSVAIAQMPTEDQTAALQGEQESVPGPKLGLGLAEITPEAREALQLEEDVSGVVVTEVEPGSAAAEKGLRRGDVIVEADRQPVSEPGAVRKAVQAAAERGEETILLLVQRDGQSRFVAVPLEQA